MALAELQSRPLPPGRLSAYVVGVQRLATTARTWLAAGKGVPKSDLTCQAYWRAS